MKYRQIHRQRIYKNRDMATADIADYIDSFDNRTRRHSHVGGVSPDEFEAAARRNRNSVH
jgi:putative transposase